MTELRWVYWLWTVGLTLLALIHLAPVVGVAGGESLQRLYGVRVEGPDLQLLIRHRAALFGIVGGVMLLALFNPNYRGLALAVGWVSVLSFILLAAKIGPINEALSRVLRVDYIALVVLVVLSAAKLFLGLKA